MSSDIWVAIIGGLVTILVGFLGYRGAIKGAMLQIEKQNKDALQKRADDENNAKKIIQSFLYDEIERNFSLIKKTIFDAIKDQSEGELRTGYHLNLVFNFATYEEVKFQLIYLSEHAYVSDIISIYKCFRELTTIDKLHELPKEEALAIYNVLNKWVLKLEVKHLK
ncbi:hypothetical protein ASG97_22745 [Bacillus sp. Soil745]|nr:hypothetical protein ASG97_22745 [Bacillus sp. Soil745]